MTDSESGELEVKFLDPSPEEGGEGERKSTFFEQKEGVDWFLSWHVWEADAFGVEKGVTLWIGGNIVSGVIIGGERYFTEIGAKVASGSDAPSDLQKSLGESYARFSEIYAKIKDVPANEYKPSIIHLRDARSFSDQDKPLPTDGTLMRVKLTSVDAFVIGQFSSNS